MQIISKAGEMVNKSAVSVIAAFLCALSMNFFLVPAHIYASGINGAAQLLSNLLLDLLGVHLTIGLLVLVLNFPIALLGWFRVGKCFTLFSFITVVLTSFFLTVLPIHPLSADPLLNSIFGGIISAAGVGLALKFGISTGGLDIIAIYLTRRRRNASTGKYFLIINGVIIVVAGAVYEWQYALYTLISRFVNSYVIDMIHTKYQKLTVMTVTDQADQLVKTIQDQFDRGVTIIPCYGGFTGTRKSTLMMVISHYELYKIERLIRSVDPNAFTDILETNKIIGTFHTEEEQKAIQAMKHGEPAERAQKTLGTRNYEYFRQLLGKSVIK